MPTRLRNSLIIAGLLAFVFFFPRVIIRLWGAGNPWTSYFYQYGLGLVFFLIGLWVILSSGACVPGRGRDTFWLGILIAGFIFLAVVHALWIWISLVVPYRGG